MRLASRLSGSSLGAVVSTLALFVSPAAAQPTFTEAVAAAPAEPTSDVDMNLTAGATMAYGNSRTFGLNVAGNLTIHESMELFVADVSFVYGVAATPLTCGAVQANPTAFPVGTVGFCSPAAGTPMDGGVRAPGFSDWRENASNFNWRLRYDHFFDADNAFFVANRGRMDYFAGLDLRLGLQLGYNRMLMREENHTLAMDIGVDATVDLYSPAVRAQNQALVAMGTALPVLSGTDARLVPALRLQLAYVNHINAVLTYDTTFEVLWDVPNPEHFRFEWVNHIRSAIDSFLQISLDVIFRLDSLPPGQARSWNEDASRQTTTMFDMLTTLNLVGNFDLDGERAAAAEEAEEIAEAVAAACPEATPCPDCPICADCAAEAAPPVDAAAVDAPTTDAPVTEAPAASVQ